eukprot:TRINITY_DN54153_c0_g1_i1.p1 TRINITY_DN54153_c0_g1~~TRINITY_DN54153_c0_g1_i1.p1  ORF type:complete len:402 (-),score=93.26 TRINITY_DN54153_c0_g1_i1:239-1360(-)
MAAKDMSAQQQSPANAAGRGEGEQGTGAAGPAGASSSAATTMQEFLAFRCNFVSRDGAPCTQVLSEAWVTQCSHVFCAHHAREWFGTNDDCPICRDGRVKMVRSDFSRSGSARRRNMSLVGLTPLDIMQASETALNFWVNQKVFEHRKLGSHHGKMVEHHKKMEEVIKQRLKEVETSCNKLEDEQRDLQKKIEVTEQTIGEADVELRSLRRQVADAEEQQKSLAKRLSGDPRRECFAWAATLSPGVEGRSGGNGGGSSRQNRSMDLLGQSGRFSSSVGRGGFSETPGSISRTSRSADARIQEREATPSTRLRADSIAGSRIGGNASAASARAEIQGFDQRVASVSSSSSRLRRLPTFTPGVLGTGRLTKRRIT